MVSTRRLAVAVAVVVASAIGSRGLHAQDVTFSGTTEACFYTGATACTPTAGPASDLLSLIFTPGTFSDPSSDGMAFIGGADDNWGTVSTNGVATDYDALGEKFVLAITFELPTLIDGQNPATFSTTVTGSVDEGDGGIGIAFDNSSAQTFYFSGPDTPGYFSVYVNPINLTGEGQNQAISGMINVTATPEPATLGLFATGLVGLVPLARRRKKAVA